MAWLLPLVPLLAALGIALASGTAGRAVSRRTAAVVGGGTMAATAALAVAAAVDGWTGQLRWAGPLGLTLDFGLDTAPASALFAILVPALAAPVAVYAAYHEEWEGPGRLLALVALSVAAMQLIAGASDLLTLLVGWEVVGACSALLVGHRWRSAENPRAGSIVFVTTRAGDLGLFLASAAAFAGIGTLAYGSLAELAGPHLHLVVLGVVSAAAAKSAQLPFAPWLFAAMKGPVSVSALLHAATMVASGAFLLIRLHPVLDRAGWFASAVIGIGLLTAFCAGTVALLQPHAKRLLAGSTSAHYGFMFIAVGAGYPAIAALHLAAHAFAKAALFLAAGMGHERADSYRLPRLAASPVTPAVAVAVAAVAAAIAGLPPLAAAWTKEATVSAAAHLAPWIGVATAVAGGLSAAYMARFFVEGFLPALRERPDAPTSLAVRGPFYLLVAISVGGAALWLSSVHGAAVDALAGEVPAFRAWEVVTSLGLVGLGAALGVLIVRGARRPREAGGSSAAADWLALPAAARTLIARPARRLAVAMSQFDDRVVDRPVGTAAGFAAATSREASAFDEGAVDAGVDLTARLAEGLAGWSRRLVEVVLDEVPEGISRLLGRTGHWTRRLQSGLTHEYFRLVVAGLALTLVLLLLGG